MNLWQYINNQRNVDIIGHQSNQNRDNKKKCKLKFSQTHFGSRLNSVVQLRLWILKLGLRRRDRLKKEVFYFKEMIFYNYYQLHLMYEIPFTIVASSISTIFLVIYLFVLLPLLYVKYKKRLVKATFIQVFNLATSKAIIQYSKEKTIFVYFDLLTSDNTKLQKLSERLSSQSGNSKMLDPQLPNVVLQKNLDRRAIKQNTLYYQSIKRELQSSQLTILCDFYDCCCRGCPWEINEEHQIFQSYNTKRKEFADWLLKLLKYIASITIKYFSYIYLPLNIVLFYTSSIWVIMIFSIFFLSFQFFFMLFTISFLQTKREMVRLDKHNDIQRALVVYYHIRRAFIFTLLNFILLITISYLINQFQNELGNKLIQCLYYTYSIEVYLHIFMLFRYQSCLKNDLISDNDRILKAQQRLCCLYNNMVKYVPSDEVWLEIDRVQTIETMKKVLDIKLIKAKEHLVNQMESIDNQKFKKIKKNLGTQKFQITFLGIYIHFNIVIMLLINVFLLFTCIPHQKNSINHLIDFSIKYKEKFQMMQTIFLIGEIILLPYLVNTLCDQRALFGRDYGDSLKQQQKK